MPAKMLTGESIKRFLKISGRRHLFITGSKGIGKTTLFNKILSDITGLSKPNIITFAVPEKAVYFRCGSQTVKIGDYCADIPGKSNKMKLNINIENICVPVLNELSYSKEEWTAIDEIGYIEAENLKYCNAILKIMDSKRLFFFF